MSETPERPDPHPPREPAVRTRSPRRAERLTERNTAYPDTVYGRARYANQAQSASGLNFVIGLWLVVAPWTLGYTHAGAVLYSEVATAGLIAFLALLRLALPLHLVVLSWVIFVAGGWLVCSPFLFDYPAGFDRTAVYWNLVIAGAVVVALAGWGAMATERLPRRRP